MSDWPYPYCPHQAFNKNLQIRLASIPYSFVPDPTIDAFTNVNIKCCNLNKHNIPSLAYEQYFCTNSEDNEVNFAKDYYLQTKDVDAIKFDNNIVEEKKEEMEKGNAYVFVFIDRRLHLKQLKSINSFRPTEKMLWKMPGEELFLCFELTIFRKKMRRLKPTMKMCLFGHLG